MTILGPRTEAFFNTFEPLPHDKSPDCLSDTELVALAHSGGEDVAKAHLARCAQCTEVVRLLQTSDETGQRLQEFLNRVREQAAARRPPFWRRAYVQLSAYRSNQGLVYALISLVVFVVLIGSIGQYRAKQAEYTRSVQFDVDKDQKAYAAAMALLDQAEALSRLDERVNPLSKQLKEKMAEMDLDELQPDQRAVLGMRLLDYNSMIAAANRQNYETRDTRRLEAVFAAYERAQGGKGHQAPWDNIQVTRIDSAELTVNEAVQADTVRLDSELQQVADSTGTVVRVYSGSDLRRTFMPSTAAFQKSSTRR